MARLLRILGLGGRDPGREKARLALLALAMGMAR